MAPSLHFTKRSMSEGATAGAAIGAAAAGILLIAGIVLFAVWYRRRHMPTMTTSSRSPHNRFSMFQWPSRSTIYVANNGDIEKAAPPLPRGNMKRCGSCKRQQHAPKQPETARVRDRRGKETAVSEPVTEEEAHWTAEIGKPLMNKPWMHMSGSRSSFSPSLSSKRATRMMMVM